MKLLYIKKGFIDFSENLAAIYRKKQVEFLLDELNNTYVACTRPEKELYILLTDSKRQKNQLIDYLFGLEELQPYVNGNIIEIGSPFGNPTGDEKSIIPQSEIPRTSVRDRHNPKSQGQPVFDDFGHEIKWMEKIKGKFGELTRISAEQIFAKRKGDVVHCIFSLIKRLPDEGQETFIRRCTEAGIARFAFGPHKREIEETISAFFRNPRFREFFVPAPGTIIFTEKEIIDGRGETFKIDRIAIADDRIDIVDFKTGERHSDDHIEQISLYARLVREVYPGKPIRSFLLYTDDGTIESVSS